MKKFVKIALSALMTVAISATIVGCGAKTTSAGIKDGEYKKQQADFDDKGWKAEATVTVSGGKITAVNFDGTQKDTGLSKKEVSAKGEYGMKAAGAAAEWHEEIKLAEDELIKIQDPTKMTYISEDGKTDAISGCTIGVKEYFTLAQEALATAK